MKFLIKYPTRERPQQFFKTLDLFVSMFSSQNQYLILVSCDYDDTTMNNPSVIDKLSCYENLKFFFSARDSKISAINRDIERIDYNWDILIAAQDDSIPVAQKYDITIASCMKAHFPDTDGVLWFDDHARKDLITIIIMGRKFYNRFGYIMNPVYQSLYAEKELMAVSKRLGKIKKIKKIIIEHRHPGFKSRIKNCLDMDELYRYNGNIKADKKTYLKRKNELFN